MTPIGREKEESEDGEEAEEPNEEEENVEAYSSVREVPARSVADAFAVLLLCICVCVWGPWCEGVIWVGGEIGNLVPWGGISPYCVGRRE